jgi:predicted GNAT superfamily acetyltransferase
VTIQPAFNTRALTTPEDYHACVGLQREIWGAAFEIVPAAMLQVSVEVGGIAAGAFDDAARLAGFVFGLTGPGPRSTIVHWSHILGVRPDLRNAGLGRTLKEFQRYELTRRNIGEMYWTYDPLIAKNAHFNLNVLGARVERFVPNMYGKTSSPLHHGLPTDRFVVVTDTSCAPRERSVTLDSADGGTPVLSARPQPGDVVATMGRQLPDRARIEIPTDFARLLLAAPTEGAEWHRAAREYFQWALESGYSITGLRRDPTSSRSFYMLEMR